MQIIKICKIHGSLNQDQVLKADSGKYTSLRCKECRRTKQILKKRGISAEDYNYLKDNQNGKCAICNKEETLIGRSGEIVPLAVDHCHKCKIHIRQLLCQSCNTGLGCGKDDIKLLKKAIIYLESHQHIMEDSTGVNHE